MWAGRRAVTIGGLFLLVNEAHGATVSFGECGVGDVERAVTLRQPNGIQIDRSAQLLADRREQRNS